MGRVRVIGLAVLAACAVLAFVVAPESGRFSQVTWLLLIAVMGLLWHLALSDGGIRRTSPVPPAGEVSAGPAPVAAAAPAAPVPAPPPVEEDLSLLPDPPANWPPPGVQVPLVFRSPETSSGPPREQHGVREAAQEPVVIDLTDDAVAERGDPEPERAAEPVPAAASGPDDPWLAFAASMLASKD